MYEGNVDIEVPKLELPDRPDQQKAAPQPPQPSEAEKTEEKPEINPSDAEKDMLKTGVEASLAMATPLALTAAIAGGYETVNNVLNPDQDKDQVAAVVQPVTSKDAGPGAHPQKQGQIPEVRPQLPQSSDLRLSSIISKDKANDQDIAKTVIYSNLTPEQAAKFEADMPKLIKELHEYGIFNNFDMVLNNYMGIVGKASKAQNIPPEIILGMNFIESSGNKDAVSPDGRAVGISQFREEAAREMGLVVDKAKKIDERLDPAKAIPAQAEYVAKYAKMWGDNLGFGVANYHAGPGNMAEAFRVYAIDKGLKDPGELIPENYKAYYDLIRDNRLNVAEVFGNEAVWQQVVSRWDDDSKRYAAKTAAAAKEVERLTKTASFSASIDQQLTKTMQEVSKQQTIKADQYRETAKIVR